MIMGVSWVAEVPQPGTEQRRWWDKGAEAEAKARDEYPRPLRELRDTLEALSELVPDADETHLVTALTRIYAPERLRRRFR